ncbi:BCCT family transporter [Alteribacillus bidgolensis]|uniref:Glycine betaine transporter n=1 Tax=Alteribacillus bidgolensis TaxID=930129 RepID=A0A1G8ECP9_9BACI|nr:BCCT family transporter [Alteribacillus bidgolensis]SDH67692.1 glycine betaine transporter [Alteribacillus bidgolensis]
MLKKQDVLRVSLLICGLFIVIGVLWTEWLSNTANMLLNLALTYFDWFYLLAASAFVGFCLYFMFSKYGKIRLGKDSERPEFSTRSWIAMLFSGGMGVGILFWSVAEPVMHYTNPPYGEASSAESAALSMKYIFFHWGLHPWAIFALLGLGLGYFQYRKDLPATISSIFYPLLGDKIYSPIGKIIDVLAVFITAIGVASTLGLSALQITGGLNYMYGIPNTFVSQIGIIVAATLLFLISALSGLHKGIKILSNVNMVLAGVLMLVLFFIGPSKQILQVFIGSTGSYLGDLVNLSFRLDSFNPSGNEWISDWTVFYWAWWMTWGPFVGSFFARISRGRTIKEYMTGVLIVPSLITFIWFSIIGVAAISQVHTLGNSGLSQAINEDVTIALFSFLDFYQMGTILSIISFTLILVFFITSADSATYVLCMLSNGGQLNPTNLLKASWGVIIAGSAIVFLLTGGLEAVRTISIVVAAPFTILLLLIGYSVLKSLKREFTLEEKRFHHSRYNIANKHNITSKQEDHSKVSKEG